ncbi:MAG: type II secretion system minor pseudopilin GspJ [Gammaproteobacteria bacterium]
MNAARTRGFTLLELLVAVALFALVAGMAYPGITRMLVNRQAIDNVQARLGAAMLGIGLLEQDISHAAARPVRDELGDAIAAMRGGVDGVLFECTRRVAPLSGFDDGSGLARIDYVWGNGRLLRREWAALDRAQATPFDERVVFEGVNAVSFEFFDGGAWQPFWPPGAGALDHERLPLGVRVALELDGGARLTRVVALDELVGG